MYAYRIPKYTMTLATYKQAKNMVIEHAVRSLLNGDSHHDVRIEKYSHATKRYEPYLNVKAVRFRDGSIDIFCDKFDITLSKAKAQRFLMDH